jgi:hypothetical protein
VLDFGQRGFTFTSLEAGVSFDLDGDGTAERTSWTQAGAEDAFLVLDRNGNGVIDNGRELFGDATVRRNGEEARHGYQALRELDFPSEGGNLNAHIDWGDAAYRALRLWTDVNHNGVSEAAELATLPERGVASIAVTYQRGPGEDQFGNLLKFVSQAYVVKEGRLNAIDTTDVFFVVDRP